jgi:hypothetical protein
MKNLDDILLVIVTAIVIWVSIVCIFASGKTESYYMRRANSVGVPVPVYCVYADMDWRLDETVYCSENPSDVFNMTTALNEQLKSYSIKPPQKITRRMF